jgi:hypothetical protein
LKLGLLKNPIEESLLVSYIVLYSGSFEYLESNNVIK